ncbi:MAG: UMP kinase, partial [Nanoarchaeota archaeon]
MDKSKPIIISLGGSLVIPNGGMDIQFLSDFNTFIRAKITEGFRFFIVVGGGATARHYIDEAKKVVGNITDWDLDFLGIHATRLNAHLLRTIFQDIAHPRIIANYEKKI